MPPRRLLILTPGELTRDPRARRAVQAAHERGLETTGLSALFDGSSPLPLEHVNVVRIAPPRVTLALRERGLGGTRQAAGGGRFVRELRGLFRLVRLGAATARLVRAGRRLGRFDVVHANDLDTLPAAWLIARRARARLVYDAHELYGEQERDAPRLSALALGAVEGALARRAASVVTVSDELAHELRERLRLRHEPLSVLNCPQLDPRAPDLDGAEGPLRAIYQGAVGVGRPLDDLFAAARAAPDVHLTVRVLGADADALRRRADELGLGGRVTVAEPVPATELADALRPFEVGLIIDRPLTRNNELAFPNKLFEYMMAGLAVAAPRLPALAPFVEGAGIGVLFEPGDPADLGRALSTLAADRERLRAFRTRARHLAETRYNAEAQAPALAAAWGL